ncbi:MAG TPA: hypothetical protein DCR40_06875 [Prolixibacteraceae bacterium]|nr:hypothetical protein [Prolixibacteraceae bacterium]
MPDYGYYNWLFVSAFQPLLPALNLPILPVTVKSSDCPFDSFFRLNLHGRSLRLATFIRSCDQPVDEKIPIIRRQSFTSANFRKPGFLPIFHLPESTFK